MSQPTMNLFCVLHELCATLPLPPDGATVVPFGEFVVENEDPPQDESAFPTAPVAMLSFNSPGFNQTWILAPQVL